MAVRPFAPGPHARGLLLAVLLTLVPVACADGAQAACRQPEEIAIQDGEHLIPGREPPVPYTTTPPTSGWHASGRVDVRVYGADEPLAEPGQVSVLERGGVVVTHRDVPQQERKRLERHARTAHEGVVAVTPYAALQPGEVVFAAWGVLQRCDDVDLDALDAFVAAHVDAGAGDTH